MGDLVLFSLALAHIANYLNQHLKRLFDLDEDVVVVSSLVESDGSPAPHINNKIVIFMFNVEKDYNFKNQTSIQVRGDNQGAVMPPLHVNLSIVIAANFSGANYMEALKLLSASSNFFQSHPVFDHQNTPDLDSAIDRLTLEFENLSLHDLSGLWGMLGGKYQPSVVYKMRTVIMDSDAVTARVHKAKQPDTKVGGR